VEVQNLSQDRDHAREIAQCVEGREVALTVHDTVGRKTSPTRIDETINDIEVRRGESKISENVKMKLNLLNFD
jgi:hypothetical protein